MDKISFFGALFGAQVGTECDFMGLRHGPMRTGPSSTSICSDQLFMLVTGWLKGYSGRKAATTDMDLPRDRH
ncbi:uncharacterized protein N7511_002675 [Penicillium nucicola]|uniref:uncharacterized protein n=1 Tax=Penicillium nucicola TaxID=1850975 RepID=UPI0025450DB4|nr:uncharacterized protein N7511_002675 [Penicillium nucicola]KAJ5770624.1 hypothetical protein N7511_002675 [Penicillium nucicola]